MTTVHIVQVQPAGPSVTAMLGQGNAKPEVGSGWTIVGRPKWIGFTEWEGVEPYRMTVPILFDGFREDRSVEPELETLRLMYRPADTPRIQPPLVQVRGPVPLNWATWAIDGLEYGDDIRRHDGQRVRAFLNLKLLEYVPADVVTIARPSPAAAATERAATPAPSGSTTPAPAPSGRTYTVRSGDTLSSIAARQLGNSNRWREIADMNGVRDPRALRVGQVLRLP